MIKEFLFKTGAVMVSNHTEPFWYASGTFGPFFINTHYCSVRKKQTIFKFFESYVSIKVRPSLFCKIVLQQYEKAEYTRRL